MSATSGVGEAPVVDAEQERASLARPWTFVPVLYFLQGVPYVLVNTVSVLMLNKMGIANDAIAFWTSLIAFPWMLKMLWSPLVELTLTRRRWILITQGLLFVTLAAAAWGAGTAAFLPLTLTFFGIAAFLSATHDIAADGFYLQALDRRQQAFFVGVRSTCFRLAMIFGTGLLVWLAGRWLEITPQTRGSGLTTFLRGLDASAAPLVPDDTARAWVLALAFGALVYGAGFLLNALLLPPAGQASRLRGPIPADRAAVGLPPAAPLPRAAGTDDDGGLPGPAEARLSPPEGRTRVPWLAAFTSFFAQPRIFWILAFILFYRFGESMIGKLSGPFLQDPVTRGGLGVPTAEIGIISGTIGVLALVGGGILGGIVISRFGIRRSLWPMVLCLNIPNLFYVWAATAKPGLAAVTALIAVDQFGYGFGFSAYMVYLMFVAQGSRFETSHYAIATGLMAFGAMGAGMLSGILQVQLGYTWFFAAVCLLSIPGMVTLFFIPLDKKDIYEGPRDLE